MLRAKGLAKLINMQQHDERHCHDDDAVDDNERRQTQASGGTSNKPHVARGRSKAKPTAHVAMVRDAEANESFSVAHTARAERRYRPACLRSYIALRA